MAIKKRTSTRTYAQSLRKNQPSLPDWDDIRVFLAVARAGQMLGAAKRLGVNHATVARRLEALEASLGNSLFSRSPSGSVLTEAGEKLLATAERIETEILAVADVTRQTGRALSGRVRIGTPDTLGNLFLAAELGAFAQRHPNLEIELVPLPRVFSLSRREADLAVVLDPPIEGRLTVTKLCDYTLSVYASSSYLSAFGEPKSLDDLKGHVIVTGVDEYSYSSSLDYGHVLNGEGRQSFRCAVTIGQIEAVKAGVGLGILHDFAASRTQTLQRILPDVSFLRSYHLVAHPDTRHLARIAECHSFLTQLFHKSRERFVSNI